MPVSAPRHLRMRLHTVATNGYMTYKHVVLTRTCASMRMETGYATSKCVIVLRRKISPRQAGCRMPSLAEGLQRSRQNGTRWRRAEREGLGARACAERAAPSQGLARRARARASPSGGLALSPSPGIGPRPPLRGVAPTRTPMRRRTPTRCAPQPPRGDAF